MLDRRTPLSPYKAHKGGNCSHAQITAAGLAAIARDDQK